MQFYPAKKRKLCLAKKHMLYPAKAQLEIYTYIMYMYMYT